MSQKIVYLHIGYHKTGTTSIQNALSKNADILERLGFLYYQDLAYNQKWFKNHTLALSIRNVKHPLIPLEENPDIVWSRFIESVNKTNASKIIVSSEVFMEGVDRERIKNYLRNFQVRIVLYLREQSDWIDSLYTEEVKHGYNKPVCEYFDAAKDSKFNYYEEVERWSKVFGKNSLHVRDYSEAVRSKGLLEDFFALVGLAENDMQKLEIIGDRSNVRASLIYSRSRR